MIPTICEFLILIDMKPVKEDLDMVARFFEKSDHPKDCQSLTGSLTKFVVTFTLPDECHCLKQWGMNHIQLLHT